MSRPFSEIVIHEGYTELTPFEIDITSVEFDSDISLPLKKREINDPSGLRLFKLSCSSGNMSTNFRSVFEVKAISSETFSYTLYPNKEGYIQLSTPKLPITTTPNLAAHKVIPMRIKGVLDNRTDETYLKVEVSPGSEDFMYTLIKDLVIDEGYICVPDGSEIYHRIVPNIAVSGVTRAVYISELGGISVYAGGSWSSPSLITFYSIPIPGNLVSISDGFYSIGTAGTPVPLNLGSGVFSDYRAYNAEPESYYVDIHLDVYKGSSGSPFYENDFTNLMPGSLDFTPVEMTCPLPDSDLSPDLEYIADLIGVDFGEPFVLYMTDKNITRLASIQKAGPISYLIDVPDDPAIPLLQSHVDLYLINKDADQNQEVIDAGYTTVFDIATTPKNVFLGDVVSTSFPLYNAAQMHELASQGQKFLSMVLAGTLSDYRMVDSPSPQLSNSTFAEEAFANNINACGCSDCKSMVSPFAYLMDLMRYCAERMDYGTTYYHTSLDYPDFINLLTSLFYQPFGSLKVNCDTLHDEYCRVRLVTEVLEIVVGATTSFRPTAIATLNNTKANYLLLVYKALLRNAGTSLEELRNIISIADATKKEIASQKWADKIGITLKVGTSSVLTSDRLWLTPTATVSTQILNQANLADLFGYRSTSASQTAPTPTAKFLDWQNEKLEEIWEANDYKLTSFSREGATSSSSVKTNWKPIIDPDIMGVTDMPYNFFQPAIELWTNRKANTDEFLSYYHGESVLLPDVLSRTSADLNNRQVKVLGRNLLAQQIDDNKIELKNSSASWIQFSVFSKSISKADTILSLSNPTPVMFQPDGTSPKMRYKRVLAVPANEIDTVNSIFTIDWPTEVIQDVLASGYARLESSGEPLVTYATSGGTDPMTVTYPTGNKKATIDLGSNTASTAFADGNVSFIYEVEVDLFTTEIPDPEKTALKLFNKTETYVPITPAYDANKTYNVWTIPSAAPWDSGLSDYGNLKNINTHLKDGSATADYYTILTDNLHITTEEFSRMMELMELCENYLSSTFNSTKPSDDEIYEMASIFRNCAKFSLREYWIKEELRYVPTGGSAILLMLSKQYFWKSISEPQAGAWDPRLQTIPELVADINDTHVPILDPELVSKSDILTYPSSEIYLNLYDARVTELALQLDNIYAWVGATLFTKTLNYVATGDETTAYNILPYTSLENMLENIQSNDTFAQGAAVSKAWSVFSLTREDFISMMTVKTGYESTDPSLQPTSTELDKCLRLLLSAYKRKQLYNVTTTGWIQEEVSGSATSSTPVKYYNVFPMKMAPIRANAGDRTEWQLTLAAWNRQPFVNPDIIPPENIKTFITTNYAHDKWVSRKAAEDTLYTAILAKLTPLATNLLLLAAYKGQIDLLIARDSNSSVTPPTPPLLYFPYFTDIADKESAGEDIIPILEQLGFTIAEYRYLRKIYDYLFAASSSASPTLLPEEYDDLANIMLAIRKRNLSFGYVVDEFNSNVKLTEEYFVLFKPEKINFPENKLPVVNSWRFSLSEQKAWNDLLEGRIERKVSIKDKWKESLLNVEDDNMPYMRDGYIEALRNSCETFNDAADRLAKTYFIETRDNCCVKHTRVSFAIETIQGLVFALQNGIFDGNISNFKLFAPYISREWEWMGSYASWRSAVFVFVYPENMLYPTLKRRQSPKFQEITGLLQGATRFSPEDACKAAKSYTDYFNDMQELQIICTANTASMPINDDPTGCCGSSAIGEAGMTYFFAKAPSGYSYWSYKYTDDNSTEAHSFWEQLPTPIDALPIGCFVLADYNGLNIVSKSLWLFYTYWENGKLVLAYFTKEVSKSNTSWKGEKVNDLPTFKENATPYQPYSVIACQQSAANRDPSFIISYKSNSWGYYHCHILLSRQTKKISPESFDITGPPMAANTVAANKTIYNNWESNPISAVNFRSDPSIGGGNYQTIALSFQGGVVFLVYGQTATLGPPLTFDYFVGMYELSGNSGVLLVLYADYTSNSRKAYMVTVTVTGAVTFNAVPIATSDLSPDLQGALSIYPTFTDSTDYNRIFAISSHSNLGGAFGARLNPDYLTPALASSDVFMLTPDGGYRQAVDSSECIPDLQARKLMIEQHMSANTNAPLGSVSSYYKCTSSQLEYLVEAYYFVPMLLALDQQQRGQYETALTWYKTIYDYTEDLAVKRKIYYGLTLEESIANTYDHALGWLLDPLNPHLIAQTRANSHTKYVLLNIIQCIFGYADRQYTMDTVETVPQARKLYSAGLELLKAPELNIKTNACIDISSACLSSGTILNSDAEWNNMFEKLQGLLNSYSSPSLTSTRVNYVLAIFNGTGSLTSKFTAAFDYLYANPPSPGSSPDVVDVMDELPDRMNDAYRYVLAFDNSSVFHQGVASSYRNSVANVSGLTRSEVSNSGSVSRISWLNTAVPQNTTEYSQSFASVGGTQNMPNNPFNPLNPDSVAFSTNVAYSNAPIFASYQSTNILPYNYAPLIDFNFCLPSNPVYSGLKLRGNLELYKIFNCRNIAGMVRELDPYAAATDSTTGVPVIGAGGTLNVPGNKVFSPSQYKFRVLIERAKQLAGQSQQLESLFLSAMEKLDAENYNYLQAKQGLETAKATVRLQDLKINQANNEKAVVGLQKNRATFMQEHFGKLIMNGYNYYEQQSLNQLTASINLMNKALVLQSIAASIKTAEAIASVAAVAGSLDKAQAAMAVIGIAGEAIGSYSGIQSSKASIESANSQLSNMYAGFERRKEEWSFQEGLAGQDIGIIAQQFVVAEDNVRIVTQEREIASLNVSHAEESLNFLQNKFTNAALYGWMSGVLERSYSYMLNTCTAVARTAERQLYFERQEQAGPFILNDYWEAPSSGGPGGSSDRRGLTGSARLLVDITKLEQHAFDSFRRKLQLTKVISLSNNFPDEFQTFKETGVLNFQLTNKQFDYDYPGHYLRLINDVKTTFVGLVPTYDGIKATLTADTISYTVIGGNSFQKMPIKRLELDSVALTSTTLATGVFDMQPSQSEILNPFEGMGIESRWEFKLPQFSNRFDFANIADVVLTVNYTALDSYLYRYQVLQELDNKLSFSKAVSFKSDFPDQWFELGEAEIGSSNFGVTFEFKRDMFPSGIMDLKLNKAENILLYFARKDGYVAEINVLDFSLFSPQSGTNYSGGTTLEGRFDANQLMNTLGNSPVMKLRLLFDNIDENRKMFKDGSIQDIFMLIPCKAELKSYPM